MNFKNHAMTTLFLGVVLVNCVSTMGDVSLPPITQQELINDIQKTPVSSPQHKQIIMRAYSAHLLKAAYNQYTLIWQKQPNNASANLRRGVVAMEYWEYATKPSINELPLGSSGEEEIAGAADSCLQKAMNLAPKSASANAEYGHWLFYRGNTDKGVQLLKKAQSLAPKSSTAYSLLGAIYASPNPPYYQPILAEKNLRTAIRIDPLDSYPHWVLARLYLDKRHYNEAEKEMQVYLNLAPPASAQEGYVKQMQIWIARGLGKN